MFYRPSQLTQEGKNRILQRFWSRDPSLWSSDPGVQASVRDRLGWLSVVNAMRDVLPELQSLPRQLAERGITRVVLLGMGGSSLCPLVLEKTFPRTETAPLLRVLDTTDPDEIESVSTSGQLGETLFVVASKSGSTMEPNAQFQYFWDLMKEKVPEPGGHFLAITDPGSSLSSLAAEKDFWKVYLNRPDIGGRYSALSYFGLVPAAMLGIDLAKLLDRADAMIARCAENVPWDLNPGCQLADFLAEYALQNRDKLTVLADPSLRAFTLWLDQLVAESSGKETRGIVPISGESTGIPGFYGAERIFVNLKVKTTPEEEGLGGFVEELKRSEFPVYEIVLEDIYDLGGQFFLWEMATALACHFLDVNPFDEPDVRLSKEMTAEVIEACRKDGKMPVEFWVDPQSQIHFRTSRMVAASMKSLPRAIRDVLQVLPTWGYLAFLPYLPYDPEIEEIIGEMRHIVRQERGCATMLGFGPRYLHSTGQLHKGGPLSAAFLILTRRRVKDHPPVPGYGLSFWHLQFAQALGDFEALSRAQKRVIHVHLTGDYLKGLKSFSKVFTRAVRI